MCLGWKEDVRPSFPMFKEHQNSLDISTATFSLLKPQLCHTVNLRRVRCQKAPRYQVVFLGAPDILGQSEFREDLDSDGWYKKDGLAPG